MEARESMIDTKNIRQRLSNNTAIDAKEIQALCDEVESIRSDNSVVSILEKRRDYWHDKAKGSLVDNYYDEIEDQKHMRDAYIDVIHDIREHINQN